MKKNLENLEIVKKKLADTLFFYVCCCTLFFVFLNIFIENAEEIIRPTSTKISEIVKVGEDLFSRGLY